MKINWKLNGKDRPATLHSTHAEIHAEKWTGCAVVKDDTTGKFHIVQLDDITAKAMP